MSNDLSKISSSHLKRSAYVYVRQSTAMQVVSNTESTERQYGLLGRAMQLGWKQDQIIVIDDDLGVTGSGLVERTGFSRMTAEVALAHVGIILALEVSRFARNNADWYRLLDLCGITDTLIGDNDGLYHPSDFNDRLVLGLKGTMSEAELHILRARLDGGIRNKAARGELRRGLPIGFVWGDKDVNAVWSAPTTTDRDRKQLLRTLVEEVNVSVNRDEHVGHLILRWRGGAITELDVNLWHAKQPVIRTPEDTIDLIRRLAAHYPDSVIAGILNRQGRKTATGERFTANRVGNLRRYRNIPRFQPGSPPPEGTLANIKEVAEILEVAPSTVHRWLNDGFIVGEQLTPGAPWRIRLTDDLRKRFVDDELDGYVPMIEATRILGVSRQTVLQRVKRGELEAVHLRKGKRKGLRIKVLDAQTSLFDELS